MTAWTGRSASRSCSATGWAAAKALKSLSPWTIPGVEEKEIKVFTTRPDTVYGVTFMVLAPEHPLVAKITTPDKKGEVEEYIKKARRQTEIERLSTEREKDGVFTGAYAVNRLTGEKVPIWIADYVLTSYGTGRGDGRARPRYARFCLCQKIRSADQGGHLSAGLERRGADKRPIPRPGTMVNSGQFNGTIQRGRHQGSIPTIWRRKAGAKDRQLQTARLADFPPALLGRAHPDDLLSENAASCRCRKKTCRSCCRRMPSSNLPANRR